jgi:hypothetical protein
MKKGPHRGPFLVFGATLDLEKAAPGGRVSASAGPLLDLAFIAFIAGSRVLDGADFATAGLANLPPAVYTPVWEPNVASKPEKPKARSGPLR